MIQIDVKASFLSGNLNEELYIEQHEGYITKEKKNTPTRHTRQFTAFNKPQVCCTCTWINYCGHFGVFPPPQMLAYISHQKAGAFRQF